MLDDAKKKYRELCAAENIPIFSQAWWLDAICGSDNWNVVLVEKSGSVVAAMPYLVRRKLGFTLLTMPPLTQNLGPWIRSSAAKGGKVLGYQKELMQALIEALPRYDHFRQAWHYSVANWIPFYWAGFQSTVLYTYTLDLTTEVDEIWAGFDPTYRNQVRKAEKLVTVLHDLSAEEFYRINSLSFERQGISVPYSFDIFCRQDRALAERGCRKVLYAVDSEGNIHSALYLVWDSTTAYTHLVGEDPAFRSSCAGKLLIWEAIKFAKESLSVQTLDFEGSMIESVERVRRDCGGRQSPYFVVTRTPSRLLRTFLALKSILKG